MESSHLDRVLYIFCQVLTICLVQNKFKVVQAEQINICLTSLQKLYVALDEPDGVAGVAAINQGQPRLEEQILAYESTGTCMNVSNVTSVKSAFTLSVCNAILKSVPLVSVAFYALSDG